LFATRQYQKPPAMARGRFEDPLPVDLHAERVVLGLALYHGTPSLLGSLQPHEFYDTWHQLIARAILSLRGKRFAIAEVAARVPVFLHSYMLSLITYSSVVMIKRHTEN